MRIAASITLLAGLALAAAPAAIAQAPAAPTAPPQHVTVPSLPGQPNQQGTVTPSGALPTDSEGYAITNRLDASGQLPSGTPAAGPAPAGAAPQGPKPKGNEAATTNPNTAAANIPVGPAPTGPAVATGANIVHIRGTVKAIDAGKTLTMTVRGTGRDVTYTLKSGASVPPGLKAGDSVRVRVQAAEKGKIVDRVEIVPPAKPAAAPAK